ncbi:LapA family protein [Chitiniphilus eburneus]|uniref:LapA family protein n=1 Tax=Chitiniphilus eburneus TaxID=2571148 RepID=A0A4U0PZB7_9NEIS|nr:LapA family protein [Chitiniphilus eburneus]TJZ74023.1 LapA family protein [Chitiniphilus eburneus]
MRYLLWLIKFLLFVVLFVFAMHNAEPVALKFLLGYSWEAPLALVLLAFFILGALLGLTAALGQVVRQRRELVALRKELRNRAAPIHPAAPDPLLEQPRDAV